MRIKYLIAGLAGLFLAGAGHCSAASAERKETRNGSVSSTLEDQTNVALTSYNVGLGLVKDQRRIKLSQGISDLRFMDVAAQIVPPSVHLKSLINPETLHVLEQNYEYDTKRPSRYRSGTIKKEDVVVKVVEPIPGDWTMLNSSHPYKKSEAFQAEFNVPVPTDREVKLSYRVRMRY